MTPAPDERVTDAYIQADPVTEADEPEVDADENDHDNAEDEPTDSSAATKKKKKKKKKKKAAGTNADGAAGAAAGAEARGTFVPASFGSKPCPSRLITGFTDSYVQYGQTEPPTIPVAELPAFRNGNFPVSYMSIRV
jgi:methionyl aminopeptidase